MELRHITRALGDKLSLTGKIHTTPRGDQGLTRHSLFEVNAKVFGVGRMLERTVEDSIRQSLDATARFVAARHDTLDRG